jgi:2-polyprenyl-3-methyl-5-hydroxy-6-metoxy-1,4-benzoquinol methylase
MVDDLERDRAKRSFADPGPYLRNNPYVALRARVVRSMLPTISPKSILDLGCGNGRISIPLVGDSDELLLIDASRGMLELALQDLPPTIASRVQFQCADVAAFQPAKQFDVVLCIGLLAHVPDPQALFQLVSRCVAPNGCALLQFTDNSFFLGRAAHWLGAVRGRLFDPEAYALNRMTSEQVLGGMAAHGFKMTRSYRYLFLPGVRRLPPRVTQAIVNLAARKPISNWGGEVIATFSR